MEKEHREKVLKTNKSLFTTTQTSKNLTYSLGADRILVKYSKISCTGISRHCDNLLRPKISTRSNLKLICARN